MRSGRPDRKSSNRPISAVSRSGSSAVERDTSGMQGSCITADCSSGHQCRWRTIWSAHPLRRFTSPNRNRVLWSARLSFVSRDEAITVASLPNCTLGSEQAAVPRVTAEERPKVSLGSIATETRTFSLRPFVPHRRHNFAGPETTRRAMAQSRCAPARCAGARAERPEAS